MFHRRTCFVEDYKKDIAAGRGSGRFELYNPYLEVQDVPSVAVRYKVPLISTERTHHLLSYGELMALLQFDWMDSVIEICEQYPLDPDMTKLICMEKDLRHPSFGGRLTVMTTDFLVTFDDGLVCERKAYQVKPSRLEAESGRTAEKLEIEKEYWSNCGMHWELMVSEEFNRTLMRNLEALYQSRNTPLGGDEIEQAMELWGWILEEIEPNCEINRLSEITAPIGNRILNGYQIAVLLLARKKLSAPLERIRLDELKIWDLAGSINPGYEIETEVERRL